METQITNLQQLKARIAFLEVKKAEDEIYFNQKFVAIKEKILNPFKFIKETFRHLRFGITHQVPGGLIGQQILEEYFYQCSLIKPCFGTKAL